MNLSGNRQVNPAPADDSATPVAVEMLAQLARLLDEARHVITGVQAREAALRLDELNRSVGETLELAEEARCAAVLLLEGAELAPAWGVGPSRPNSVIARHRHAVSAGAREIRPASPQIVIRQRRTSAVFDFGVAADFVESKRCIGLVSAKRQCRNQAVVFIDGVPPSRCYGHLTPIERRRYTERKNRQTEQFAELANQDAAEAHRCASDAIALWTDRQRRELAPAETMH